MNFHIARAFELFKDDIVHTAARVDERGCDDGERSAVFDVSSRTEEAFGAVQCAGIDTPESVLPVGGMVML